MRTKVLVVAVLALILGMNVLAQEARLAQVSFIYPIGTGGLHAEDYSNKFSFNVLAGMNGGVDGLELGSLCNINKGNVNGTQIGGLCNYTTGNSKGAIISGLTNVTLGNSSGAHVSGLLNYSEGSINAGMIAGLANITLDNSTGALVGGLFNITKNHSSGLLLGGVGNIVMNESAGAAVSGVVNYAGAHKGLQLATINVAAKKLDGAQIGVINVANKARGLQLGVINICNNNDSILPIGLFSVVRDGYYAFEVSTSELFHSNLSFKMGTEQFYSIFTIALGTFNDSEAFRHGLGFGSIFNMKKNHNLNIEVIGEQIIYDTKWEGVNMLNHLDLNYQYDINEFLSVKAGPSINTYVTEHNMNSDYETINIPYTLFEHVGDNVKTSLWVGFNVGVVIKR